MVKRQQALLKLICLVERSHTTKEMWPGIQKQTDECLLQLHLKPSKVVSDNEQNPVATLGRAGLRHISWLNIMEYKFMLAFFFAIDEINGDPNFLPNITLGYHLYNTCGYPIKTLYSVLKIISGHKETIPNYSCMGNMEVAGFVGDTTFPTTLTTAEFLKIYQYPQISSRVTDPLLDDRNKYPTFYRTIPSDWVWYQMIINVLEIFDWNWVGVILSPDGSGETGLKELRKQMAGRGICTEFVIYLTDDVASNRQKMLEIEKTTTDVIIVCGHYSDDFRLFFEESKVLSQNITLILHESWHALIYTDVGLVETANCSLIFLYALHFIPSSADYLSNIHPSKCPDDPILEDIWIMRFCCPSGDQFKNRIFQKLGWFPNGSCSEKESIADNFSHVQDSRFYFTYTAVYFLAHALSNMNVKKSEHGMYRLKQRLHRYVQRVRYTDPINEEIFFNDRGHRHHLIYLANMIFYDPTPENFHANTLLLAENEDLENGLNGTIWKQGTITCEEKDSVSFFLVRFLELDAMTGVNQDIGKPPKMESMPAAIAVSSVPMGKSPSRQVLRVTNVFLLTDVCCLSPADSDICYQCPSHQWPDEKKVRCIPKEYEYLSYKMDTIAQAFSVVSLLCSTATLFILKLFFVFRDTPVVKANNLMVSFILLVSILMSFLCIFLFLGCPIDITCMLRQVSFGIFFSIAVSSVLAKTITACVAFKATKPNSHWKKWMGGNVSKSVVFICSSVQVLFCLIWLSVSPPYQEFDMTTYHEKIIIQCNEGSVIGFYMMLGYLGFLAAVSFVLAFMVRTLPDSFNEAKYITFSMLVFCSVWIAMIPAYLSTRGKYMVAVEVFAILSSSSGILGFIFFPKCYIIIIKPERNTRKYILKHLN
ncbi:vomeronasal type-2 receptor 26-like [Gastrophryne carolinensis]